MCTKLQFLRVAARMPNSSSRLAGNGKGEAEGDANIVWVRFETNFTAVTFNNSLDQCETKAYSAYPASCFGIATIER